MTYTNPFLRGGAATPAEQEPEQPVQEVRLFGTPYQPAVYPELAFKFCLLGATDDQLCELLDISHDTLPRWRKEHRLFNRSIVEGRQLADAEVAHSLYKCATGYEREQVKIFQFQGMPVVVPYTEYYAPDVNAAKHWLAVRQKAKWRETTAIDVESRQVVETRSISADATPEQAADMYKRMLG